MQTSLFQPRRCARGRRIQVGIGLIEIIIALGIVGALIAVVLRFQADATAGARTQDVIRGVTQMAGDISNTFGRANDFSTVTNTSVMNGRLVSAPFRLIGTPPTTINDAHGIVPTFAGGATHFGISFTEPDIAACAEIATALFAGAARMHIVAGPATPHHADTVQDFVDTGTLAGGAVVKMDAASLMDPAAITAACSGSGASRVITVAFR